MDVFENLSIKLPNAVLVEGTTQSSDDEEVFEFLNRHGKINRRETINDSDSEFDQTIVVEFETGAAVAALKPALPYTFVSSKTTGTYLISELSAIYSKQVVETKTETYLTDMKNLAKVSGLDLAEVLSSVINQIGRSVSEGQAAKELKQSPGSGFPTATPSTTLPAPTTTTATHYAAPLHQAAPHLSAAQSTSRASLGNLPPQDLNPPEVQRLVVEHIVKSDDVTTHHLSAQRLKHFSGRSPRPTNEADYDTWRAGVDLLLTDPSVSDLHRSRRIVDSLLPPAVDLVRHLSPDTLPPVYLQILDSAYGTVQDGEELFAKFMDTFQDSGERPSAYLQRLQCALNLAVKRGGVLESEMNRHLLNQFCRGCWDNTLISELQLKQKKVSPPSFAELLLLLRTEEDREAAKSLRMKQHLGSTKQKVAAHAQFAHTESEKEGAIAALTSVTQQLAQQLAEVQRQLSLLTSNQSGQKSSFSTSESMPATERKKEKQFLHKSTYSQPRARFCFRCGEDGHIRPQCTNEPNSALVAHKKKQFKPVPSKTNSSTGKKLN